MSEPRDFHIGTEVARGVWRGRKMRVRGFVHPLVWCEGKSDDGREAMFTHNVDHLVHASDGAPLGEWVPVPEGVVEKIVRGAVEYGDMTEDINRWIRGELEPYPHPDHGGGLMRVTDELRVLVALSRWFPWDYGNAWPTYTVLARRIRRSEADTRAAVAKLVEAGYLRHGPAWDPEGIPCGSGYFLTPLFYRESGATPLD